VWRRELSATALDVSDTNGLSERTVAAADGTAVVTGRGVLCLDLRTGRTLWSLDPEEAGTDFEGRALHGGATIDGTAIYLTLLGQDLVVVGRDRRKRRWAWERPGTLAAGPSPPPLLAGGYVFPQTDGGAAEDAIAVSLRTHRTAWTLKTAEREYAEPQLLADDRTLYVLRGSSLRAFPLA
jgi:outer membrane protein assembly factor BamB